MLNYEAEPKVLLPYVPAGTELDLWSGTIYLSVVGFQFLNTRVLGVPIPFHRHFDEVNLRFYVRRKAADGWRRGVVFIKEIVPRAAIAFTARYLYNENYIAARMGHEIRFAACNSGELKKVSYRWEHRGNENRLEVRTGDGPVDLMEGSHEQFIAEHYWGYSAQPDGTTMEYQVEHPSWRIWSAESAILVCDVGVVYGDQFADYVSGTPASAFVADGSSVTVYRGARV
jgi:uncharacterized protein YqjF (DUF2071 family)